MRLEAWVERQFRVTHARRSPPAASHMAFGRRALWGHARSTCSGGCQQSFSPIAVIMELACGWGRWRAGQEDAHGAGRARPARVAWETSTCIPPPGSGRDDAIGSRLDLGQATCRSSTSPRPDPISANLRATSASCALLGPGNRFTDSKGGGLSSCSPRVRKSTMGKPGTFLEPSPDGKET